MDIGIIGFPLSGKTTLFEALTGGKGAPVGRGRLHSVVGTAHLPEPRLAQLAGIFHSRRLTYPEVRYHDFPVGEGGSRSLLFGGDLLNAMQEMDCLLAVVRAFEHPTVPTPPKGVDPRRDLADLEAELLLADLSVVERRLQRLEQALKGAKPHERSALLHEQGVLQQVWQALEAGRPLRSIPLSKEEGRLLANFHLLTAKPLLVVVNIGEEDLPRQKAIEDALDTPPREGRRVVALCARLERDLALMPSQEAQAFRASMGLEEDGVSRVVRALVHLLSLLTFFTGNQEEVRAWLVPQGTSAVEAAGRIHSDMERGFIRAEVIPWDVLVACGSMAEARRRGLLRSEGKTYRVQDGDVVHILFSV
ncbi:MAG: DUF933 domain-containing protein [Dehalococcoidia bacterium]|nr:DUF933 domain-containing protein [Dehalococcoidia bacterium]MDW8119280.1 DUF933 domain-containing protein [Chloroflexota bacterium]